jgi:hypothetical protein
MSQFRTVHYLGEMMCKRPESSVNRAVERYSQGPGFRVLIRLHNFSHPVTSKFVYTLGIDGKNPDLDSSR